MKEPKIGKNCFIASDADIKGGVTIGDESSIWYHAVLRCEKEDINIGERTSIQDNVVIHNDAGFEVNIGSDVTVGHSAILHGCTIGDNTVIGMGSIILNGAKIGKNSIVGAGSLVTQGKEFPDGVLLMGSPAKVKRELTAEEIEENRLTALEYVAEKEEHRNLK